MTDRDILRGWITLCEAASGLRFYHGTHPHKLANIVKVGLTPDPDRATNGSSILGWTDRNVYLTDTEEYARGYGSVVLAVDILDESKLVPDDDYLIDAVMIEMARRNGWTPPAGNDWCEVKDTCDNYSGILQAMQIILTGSLEEIAEAAYYNWPAGRPYVKILKATALRAMKTPWRQAIRPQGSVSAMDGAIAYRGVIPPEQITVISQ